MKEILFFFHNKIKRIFGLLILFCVFYIFIKCFYLYTGETLIMYIRGCFVLKAKEKQ